MLENHVPSYSCRPIPPLIRRRNLPVRSFSDPFFIVLVRHRVSWAGLASHQSSKGRAMRDMPEQLFHSSQREKAALDVGLLSVVTASPPHVVTQDEVLQGTKQVFEDH